MQICSYFSNQQQLCAWHTTYIYKILQNTTWRKKVAPRKPMQSNAQTKFILMNWLKWHFTKTGIMSHFLKQNCKYPVNLISNISRWWTTIFHYTCITLYHLLRSQQTWSGFSPTTVPDNNRQSGFSPTTVPKLSTGMFQKGSGSGLELITLCNKLS